MSSYLLSQTKDETRMLLEGRGIVSTRAGLVKGLNEDAVGYAVIEGGIFRISIADGHWGQEAAKLCAEYWTNDSLDNDPIQSMTRLERMLANRYAVPSPDPEVTRTPEASTLTVTIYPNRRMDVVGYGDCRLSVVRNGHVLYRYDTIATWLGLFSSVGIRDRVSARNGTHAESIQLSEDDTIVLYTDGVDECVYEIPTLDVESFVDSSATAVQIHDEVMAAVMRHGAEDNATIAVLKL